MADFSNIPTGLKITSQIPLNSKEWVQNEATLAYLGVDNNLAYTYHDQLIVNCLEEKSKYIWREVQPGEENTGLVPLDFTYPLNLPETYNINYSGKTYNFFEIDLTGPQGPQGIPGPAGNNGQDYTSNNLQKIVTSFPYTISNDDNNYTVILQNNILVTTVNIPTGLMNNLSICFIQEGTGKIVFEALPGVTLKTPTGLQIKGDNYQAYLEKVGSTENYHLLGNLI